MSDPVIRTRDLRMRALPGGITAYLTGRTVSTLAQIGSYVALILTAGLLFAGLELPAAPGDWLTLLWVLALGTLSVVPLGAVLPDPRNAAAVMSLILMGLLLAPALLRRMTRRESGSRLAERQQRRAAQSAY